MVLPTVTENPPPPQRVEHDSFADLPALRDDTQATAEVIALRRPTRELTAAA
jgi:hypothetical protein